MTHKVVVKNKKLGKKASKLLKIIADGLPVIKQPCSGEVKQTIKGSTYIQEMVKMGKFSENQPEYKTDSGLVIDKDKTYLVSLSKYIPVNHFKRLKNIYLTQGMVEVNKYVTNVKNRHALQLESESVANIKSELKENVKEEEKTD